LWDLNRREEAAICKDYCLECGEDLRDFLGNLDENLVSMITSDPLEFSNRLYELLWKHVEGQIEAELEVYIPGGVDD
jgi:hypothetical protein